MDHIGPNSSPGSSVAVNRLPDFLAAPNAASGQLLPHHQCSIHLNCEDTLLLHQAFEDAEGGHPSRRWVHLVRDGLVETRFAGLDHFAW